MVKKKFLSCCIPVFLLLSACGVSAQNDENIIKTSEPANVSAVQSEPPAHSHTPSAENHTIAHEETGYCGNTVTTITRTILPGTEPLELTFWGSDSVTLTDFLRYLDYSEDICRCLPEYHVDTEFGTDYGINLTESYVRYHDKQASLTAEQVQMIQDILDRQSAQK